MKLISFLAMFLGVSAVAPSVFGQQPAAATPEERLKGFRKRMSAEVQFMDLNEQFPLNGDVKLRRTALAKVLDYFPKDKSVHVDVELAEAEIDGAVGDLLLQLSRIHTLRNAPDAKLSVRQTHKADFMEALGLLQLSKISEALPTLESLATNEDVVEELRADCIIQIIEAHVSLGQLTQAKKWVAKGMKEMEGYPSLRLAAAQAAITIMEGRSGEAHTFLKELRERHGTTSHATLMTALIISTRAAWLPVGNELVTVVDSVWRGQEYAAQLLGYVPGVKKDVAASIGLVPMHRGLRLEWQGKLDEAIQSYAKLPAALPQAMVVRQRKFLLLAELGRREEALKVIAAALEAPTTGIGSGEFNELMMCARIEQNGGLQTFWKTADTWWPDWVALATSGGIEETGKPLAVGHQLSPTPGSRESFWLEAQRRAHHARWSPVGQVRLAEVFQVGAFHGWVKAADCRAIVEKILSTSTEGTDAKIVRRLLVSELLALATIQNDTEAAGKGIAEFKQFASEMDGTWQQVVPLQAYHALVTGNALEEAIKELKLLVDATAESAKAFRRDASQLLAALYLAAKRPIQSEAALQDGNAGTLDIDYFTLANRIRLGEKNSAVATEQVPLLRRGLFLVGKRVPELKKDAVGKASGTGVVARPVWLENVDSVTAQDERLKLPSNFLKREQEGVSLVEKLKGCLLLYEDQKQSAEVRSSAKVELSIAALALARTETRWVGWREALMPRATPGELTIGEEVALITLALQYGALDFAKALHSRLAGAAGEKPEQSLGAFLDGASLHLQLLSAGPGDKAQIAKAIAGITKAPIDSTRGNAVVPGVQHLVNLGLLTEAAELRAKALKGLSGSVKEAQALLDQTLANAKRWKPLHDGLSQVLWSHVDRSKVNRPQEFSSQLRPDVVNYDLPMDRVREILFYQVKEGGFHWNFSLWSRLLGDALPDDTKWGKLKRELCQKALELAPDDAVRAMFANEYWKYFSLADPENREQLKKWLAPYRMKEQPKDAASVTAMEQTARWLDLHIAFSTMDAAAMKTLQEVPPHTASLLDVHWRLVAAMTGRGQVEDVKRLMTGIPAEAYQSFEHYGTMIRALRLIGSTGTLADVSKSARKMVKTWVNQAWAGGTLTLLPIIIDVVDALDEPALLPEAFQNEVKTAGFTPWQKYATAWFCANAKDWKGCKDAAQAALAAPGGQVLTQPNLHLALGFACAHLGEKQAAVDSLAQFMKLAPSSIHYKTAADLIRQLTK